MRVRPLIPLLLLALATAVRAEEVEFRFDPPGDPGTVHLAGDFNNWNPSGRAMTDEDGDGVFTTSLDLPPGRYQYKFVAGGSWYEDPAAKESEADGFGGRNSVRVVGEGNGAGGFVGGGSTAAAPATESATGSATSADADGVTFRFAPGRQVSEVFLAGEFNEWSQSATPMTDDDGDGTWEATVQLAPGRYAYKFVVDGSWMEDPRAAESEDDGYGGKNSVIVVGEGGAVGAGGGAAAPAAAAGDAVDVTFRYSPMISGIRSCHLVGEFNQWSQTATPMTDEDGDGTWEATVALAPGRHAYKFLVDGGTWLEDPNAEDSVDDGYGGKNSVIVVGGSGRKEGPGKPRRVTFEFKPTSKPSEVSLCGTFNNWAIGKTPMADEDGDGTWSVTLLLPEDTYQYKFVADGNWITDPNATDFADDGFGGKNSIVVVDDRFPGIELELGDGRIFTEGLEHHQTSRELNRVSDGELEITVKTYQNDVEAVELRWDRGAGREGGTVPLAPVATDATYIFWSGVLRMEEGIPDDLRYELLYRDGGTAMVQSAGGAFHPLEDGAVEGEEMFTYSADRFPRFTTPDWVANGVFYQIFPERFANGDPSNDPDFSEEYYKGRTSLPAGGKKNGEYYHLVEDWTDVSGLSRSPYRTDGLPDYFSFYGGDIAGVRQHLDYLEDLGVTIVYFNPLFQARSNHKYEAYDYMSIDPHFGTPEEFRELVADARSRGIRIVVDWVINHIGEHSPYFQDTVKRGKDSEYWNWFEWRKWPLPATEPSDWTEFYACWWGFAHMPDLNYDLSRPASDEHTVTDIADAEVNWPVVNYVLDSARWWLDLGVDGFRLDVANEVPFWMWELFRNAVREVRPDAYLVGEIWGDAGDWVSARCFDATMNYKYFKDPVMDFIGQGRIDAARFDKALAGGRIAYPAQATRVMMNLIDSHDTPRYLTAIGGDVRRQKVTALFEMTYVGAPHIYYGDEIAMRGDKDPDCRRPFVWSWEGEPERADMHDWYRRLIHLRRDHPALVTGSFRTLVAEGPVYVFERSDGTGSFVVALNVADREATVDVPLGAEGTWSAEPVAGDGRAESGADGLTVRLPGVSGTVFRLTGSS